GNDVFLKDIWPSAQEIRDAVQGVYEPGIFNEKYADLFEGGQQWEALAGEGSERFDWQPESTYIRRPPYFKNLPRNPLPVRDIVGMRPLVILGHSVTTDH